MKHAKHWIYSDELETALSLMNPSPADPIPVGGQRQAAIPHFVRLFQAIQRDALDGAAERVAAFAWAEETIRAMKDEL